MLRNIAIVKLSSYHRTGFRYLYPWIVKWVTVVDLPNNIHDFITHVWELQNITISVVLMLNNGGVQFTGPVLEDLNRNYFNTKLV